MKLTRLCLVLQNPSPSNGKSISRINSAIAASVLGHDAFDIVNLLQVESRNSRELETCAPHPHEWVASREHIKDALASGDEVLFGWGQSKLGRGLEIARLEQIDWVRLKARQLGHTHAWTVGAGTRHPSRWRQYVGPVRGLYPGATFPDRLRQALVHGPI